MAWITIEKTFGEGGIAGPYWEYSNDPDTDDPVNGLLAIIAPHPQDPTQGAHPDLDPEESIYTGRHTAGIRSRTVTNPDGVEVTQETYVFCRMVNKKQVEGEDVGIGYGELSKTFLDAIPDP